MSEPIRILVADDHPVLRDGLIAVLSTQSDFEVIGEAGTGEEVVRKAKELQPDVVVLDLEMPVMDGVEALKLMRASRPDIRVIIFTVFDTDERILGAVQAGAKGYLLKGAPRDQLFDAIRIVHAGGSLLQPIVASRLLERISQVTDGSKSASSVTPREMDVLRLMAQGFQNKEIADDLGITERTVKFHVGSILSKMGAGNRTEAVTIAVHRGLIKL